MLTIDIGNTRIKWAAWHAGCITRAGGTEYSKHEPEAAFDIWDKVPPEKHIIVACVAGESIENALTEWLRVHWSVKPGFLRSSAELNGVSSAYTDPSQYGVDRWAALLGAHSQFDDPVCIIDAGTAITVDLMDAEARHRGGRILPGLGLMREALLKGTEGIHQTDGKLIAFACNTADAVSSGTLHMLQAALIEVCASARQCLGSNMKIIITGGMSEQLMSLPGLPEMIHEPNLVLKGLHAVADIRLAGN